MKGYQFPYGYGPADDGLGPCRRASVLMFVLGALGVLLGACLAGVVPAIPWERMFQQQGMTLPEGQSLESFQREAVISGVVFLVVAILYVVLGVMVRRANKGAA